MRVRRLRGAAEEAAAGEPSSSSLDADGWAGVSFAFAFSKCNQPLLKTQVSSALFRDDPR